jgi:hypothetical protein
MKAIAANPAKKGAEVATCSTGPPGPLPLLSCMRGDSLSPASSRAGPRELQRRVPKARGPVLRIRIFCSANRSNRPAAHARPSGHNLE